MRRAAFGEGITGHQSQAPSSISELNRTVCCGGGLELDVPTRESRARPTEGVYPVGIDVQLVVARGAGIRQRAGNTWVSQR
jgi:hypothetical protein